MKSPSEGRIEERRGGGVPIHRLAFKLARIRSELARRVS
jgi:hypothetical protein